MHSLQLLVLFLTSCLACDIVRAQRSTTDTDTVTKRTQELATIEIYSQKPVIERKIDRLIFHAENSVSALGSDLFELLDKVPGVVVKNGDITIIGKNSVSVMINDKLIPLSGEELEEVLRSMPADNISRIEVITTPPAKYDAEGNSGIINIITKKLVKDGFNGNITAGYEQNSAGSPFTEGIFNYKKGRLNWHGDANINRGASKPVEKYTAYYAGQRIEQTNNIQDQVNWYRIQLGVDFVISQQSILSIAYTNGASIPHLQESILSKAINTNNSIDSIMKTPAQTTGSGMRNVVNMDYEWRIDSGGKKLNIDLDFFTRSENKTRNFNTLDMNENGVSTGFSRINRTYGTQLYQYATARVDIKLPSHWGTFNTGGKLAYIGNSANDVASYFDGGQYIKDPSNTNSFSYHESTGALYASFEKEVETFSFQLGLRGERTQTIAYSATLNQTSPNQYFKLFPTAYVQYEPDDEHTLNINYSRRIERPDYTLLNPFRFYSTINSYQTGNPFLQPAFSDNLELSYNFNSRYTATLFSQFTDNLFTEISVVDTALNTIYFKNVNAGNKTNYGVSFSVRNNDVWWWESITQVYGLYGRFSSAYYNATVPVAYHKAALAFETNNTFLFSHKKTVVAEINFRYFSAQQSDFDLEQPTANLSGGLKVSLHHKQIILGLTVNDLTKTDRSRLINFYNATYRSNYYDERSVRLSLTWKFGNKFLPQPRELSSTIDEETKKVKK